MGQHAALRPPGGARGVDDRGGGVRSQAAAPLLDLPVLQVLAVALQLLDRAVGQRPHLAQLRAAFADLGHPGRVGERLGDHRSGAGVGEHPGDLLGRRVLVQRHGDRAGVPDRVVQQRPLVTGAGQQPHPVTGTDAGGDQALGDRDHFAAELGGAHVLPAVAGAAGEQNPVGGVLGVVGDVVGEVGARRRLCAITGARGRRPPATTGSPGPAGHVDGQRCGVLPHVGAPPSRQTGCTAQVTAGSPSRSPRRHRLGSAAPAAHEQGAHPTWPTRPPRASSSGPRLPR